MHVNVDTDKIEIDIPGADEWIERIGKTAYGKLNSNCIKLKTTETAPSILLFFHDILK
jgi:hypothetical protein